MNRLYAATIAVCACLAVTGCGGGGESSAADATTSSAARSTSAAPTAPAPLGAGDVFVCQNPIADSGDAYGWLTTLERDRTISGGLATPGYLQVYNLGGSFSILGGVENPDLRAAVEDIVTTGKQLRAAIDAQGAVDPTPLRRALDDAAVVCEEHGFVIDWHDA